MRIDGQQLLQQQQERGMHAAAAATTTNNTNDKHAMRRLFNGPAHMQVGKHCAQHIPCKVIRKRYAKCQHASKYCLLYLLLIDRE